MRFLCLHGSGTNTQVFEAQTAALRYEMDHHHTFDFVEGTVSVPIAPDGVQWISEIKAYFPDTDTYFSYFDLHNTTSMRIALEQLDAYIAFEGPYDGVLAYSHGAALAATYIIQQAQLQPSRPPSFKCAIFISGGIPADPSLLVKDELRLLDPAKDGTPLQLPTSHIWGANDNLHPGTSATLSQLCDEAMKSEFIHKEGHDVPNTRGKEALLGAARAIKRTVEKTLTLQ